MGRLSVIIALAVLLGSAVYAYGIKYDTIVLGEQIARQKIKIQKEKDQIALLKAEWQFLNRPDRIQALSDMQGDMTALGCVDFFGALRGDCLTACPLCAQPRNDTGFAAGFG